MRILSTCIILLLFLCGILLLQIFLSRRESRWPGLVLPLFAFLTSLIYPLSMAAPMDGGTAGFIASVLLVWLLGNLPTAILLAVYFSCRGKERQRKEMEKLNLQDLD